MTCANIIRGSLAGATSLFLLLAAGCQRDAVTQAEGLSVEDGLTLTLSGMITDVNTIGSYLSNVSFYIFETDGSYSGELVMKTSGTDSEGITTYTGTVPTGTWDVVIATEKSSLTRPSGNIGTAVMYTMPGNSVTSCPEIFYGRVQDVEIQADQTTEKSTSLARNLARIFVRVQDNARIVSRENTVSVQLQNVPSTLTWAGTLYPDAESPVTINLPETDFTTEWQSTDDYDWLGDLEFIIPADREITDGYDTDLHRMTIQLKYVRWLNGEEEVVSVPVTYTPRANDQVLYNLKVSGISVDSVQVDVTVLDWSVEDTQTDVVESASAFSCIVLPRDGAREVALMDVYKELEGVMSQDDEVTAAVISDPRNAVAEVAIVNRGDSWPHSVLKVSSSVLNEGEATVGIYTNNTLRWRWHVIVSDTQSSCEETGHENGMPQS